VCEGLRLLLEDLHRQLASRTTPHSGALRVRGSQRVTDQEPEGKYQALEVHPRPDRCREEGKLDPVLAATRNPRSIQVLSSRTKTTRCSSDEPCGKNRPSSRHRPSASSPSTCPMG